MHDFRFPSRRTGSLNAITFRSCRAAGNGKPVDWYGCYLPSSSNFSIMVSSGLLMPYTTLTRLDSRLSNLDGQ